MRYIGSMMRKMGGTCSNAVFPADHESGLDIIICHGGVQEAMINHLGEVVDGDLEGCGS
jgi:hypothetical protein